MPLSDKEKVGLWDMVRVRFLDKVWVRFLESRPLNLEVGWVSGKT